jgi:hypothetical protein
LITLLLEPIQKGENQPFLVTAVKFDLA